MVDSAIIGRSIANRYGIVSPIGEGGMGSVYRAISYEDPSRTVAIKLIRHVGKILPEELLRFQKEAALMSQLHHPNIIAFHELGILIGEEKERYGSGYYIVMDLLRGKNLKEFAVGQRSRELEFFFCIAKQISSALDYTHGKGIIHRDIKPQNIVVEEGRVDEEGQFHIKILDFGVARLGDAMNYTGTDRIGIDEFAGTPLYMAPEQSPFLEGPIDHRVDLYSLGCVLYEILTGKPPFTAKTRERLQRLHAGAAPDHPSAINSSIPEILSQMVLKLISKNPDDRYLSAYSFHADLVRAYDHFQAGRDLNRLSFRLASKNNFQSVSTKLELVGRGAEMKSLIDFYEALSQDSARSRMSVIHGPSGVGKTRLMSEFRSYFQSRKIRFISGNFSQHETSIPFNALANAFNDYLLRVYKTQPLESEELSQKFKNALGQTAHLVASIVPGLLPFIKSIPTQGDQRQFQLRDDNFNSFAKAFSDFTRCLVRDNQPIVFIFDDLHWADEKSLQLVDNFFSHNNSQRFYLIISHQTGAERNNANFRDFLEKFRKLRRRYQDIQLENLDKNAVKRIAMNIVAGSKIQDTLVDVLHEKSKGNPLFLAEVVRKMVESEVMALDESLGLWSCDESLLQSKNLLFNSVDLALGRIKNYRDKDRRILQFASAQGVYFYEKLIPRNESISDELVSQVLEKAQKEGVIHVSTENINSSDLGTLYYFSHRKAKEDFYNDMGDGEKKDIHRMIASRFEYIVDGDKKNFVFLIVNHFNKGLDKDVEASFAKNALYYNLAAASEAETTGSSQIVEKYLENALDIVNDFGRSLISDMQYAKIVECLSDLAAKKGHHIEAIEGYRELVAGTLPLAVHLAASWKLIHYQMIGGIISETIQLIGRTLKIISRPIPKPSRFEVFKAGKAIFFEVMNKSKAYALLSRTISVVKEKLDLGKEFDGLAIKLYQADQIMYLLHYPPGALVSHQMAMGEVFDEGSCPELMLRVLADRAAIYGYLGYGELSLHFFEELERFSQGESLDRARGYILFLRSLIFDYLHQQFDRINQNMRSASELLSSEEDRIVSVAAYSYRSYLALRCGDLDDAIAIGEQALSLVSARNWLSVRAIVVVAFVHLIRDERDEIVDKGERYLKNRSKASGRSDEVFVLLLNTIINFARGEFEQTKVNFQKFVDLFCLGNAKVFCFPFEEDLICLFITLFPEIFHADQSRALMRQYEAEAIYKRLQGRLLAVRDKSNREVQVLIGARMMHLQNAPTSCQKPYDETLRLANISDNHLVRCLGYFWLGEYLFANGSPEKQEYMVSAMETSARLKFKALTLYMEKRLASRSIEYFRDEVDADRLRSRFQTFPTTLTMDHLFHVNQVIQSSTDTYKALEGSARLLMNHYGGSDVYVIESKNGKESITFSSHRSQDPDALIQFVTPYMNMSTSLFLPIPDLSWGGSEDSEGGVGFIEELWSQGVTVTSDTEDQEATVAVHQVGNEGDRRQRSLEVTNGQPPVMMKGRRLKMGALIPLAGSEGVKGVIFIEDIGELYKQHSVASRHELSLFGAQLGFMLECRREENSQLAFMAGRYQMDEVFWLKLWQHGQLRKSRQSTWYLGLEFSPTKYIVAFCDFAGDQTVRETLSGTIWHHLQTIKFLLLANPDVPSEISDLRDDIAHILGRTQGVRSLTRVSAVVSVFDYSQMKIFSGHFGPARPVILGQESKIKPLNSAVLQFDSRADLRYWELEGDLTKTNPFFISYDNSKLEGFMFDELQQTLVASLNQSWSDEQLHEAIASKLGPKSLPRCYVAALLSDEVNLDLLESYDKAQ